VVTQKKKHQKGKRVSQDSKYTKKTTEEEERKRKNGRKSRRGAREESQGGGNLWVYLLGEGLSKVSGVNIRYSSEEGRQRGVWGGEKKRTAGELRS